MITYMFVGSLACLAGSLALYVAFLVRLRAYERRLTQTEMHVVRQVMEESPAFVESILGAQQRLYGSLSAKEALREARRLHGMEP